MIRCDKCNAVIPDETDENYNTDHSAIKCPCCQNWQTYIGTSLAMDNNTAPMTALTPNTPTGSSNE